MGPVLTFQLAPRMIVDIGLCFLSKIFTRMRDNSGDKTILFFPYPMN